MNHTVNY